MMKTTTHPQISVDDLTKLCEMATLAQILEAGELGDDSEGPPVLNLDGAVDRWGDLLHELRAKYGQELTSEADLVGSAYMTGESQRSFLRGLVYGRALGAGDLIDDEVVTTTVDAPTSPLAYLLSRPEPRCAQPYSSSKRIKWWTIPAATCSRVMWLVRARAFITIRASSTVQFTWAETIPCACATSALCPDPFTVSTRRSTPTRARPKSGPLKPAPVRSTKV